MIPHLGDTNVLLRWQSTTSPLRPVAEEAIRQLRLRQDPLYITAQNLIEYWNVATRPLSANGLGRSLAQVTAEIRTLRQLFPFAPDHPDIIDEWQRIVVQYGVSGVQVHDARLVAVMRVHGLTHLLTFNTADFARYSDRITTVHPQSLISSP